MPNALFTINADSSNQGHDAEPDELLTLRLKTLPPAGVSTVLFQVFSPGGFDDSLGIAANPPRSSPGAPTLTLNGATSGQAVSPAAVDGGVTVTMPAEGGHSFIVRCVVNGGMGTLPDGRTGPVPALVHERMIAVRDDNGCRAVIATETTQYDDDGWAGALNEMRSVLGGGGTSIPDGSYDGQPTAWSEEAWLPLPIGTPFVLESINTPTDLINIQSAAIGGRVTLTTSSALYEQFADAFVFGVGEAVLMRIDGAGVGFLGAAPAGRQSIGPGATQDQVDALVAAFVTFGLVTDDRIP